jgi:predicted cation transporter
VASFLARSSVTIAGGILVAGLGWQSSVLKVIKSIARVASIAALIFLPLAFSGISANPPFPNYHAGSAKLDDF